MVNVIDIIYTGIYQYIGVLSEQLILQIYCIV